MGGNIEEIKPMAPKRPRSHQLEQESIIAFRQAIPKDWVFRELGQDYGVDGEIEVFDPTGEATGIKFLIQLKSTDNEDTKKACSVTFSKEKMEYFLSFDLPVLIVRYQAPSQSLFVRWFHTFDPYYGRKSSKFITFKFESHHKWSPKSSDQLIEEFKNFRELNSPSLKTPVQFELVVEENIFENTKTSQIVSKIRKEIQKLQYLIKIVPSQKTDKALNIIEISKEMISIKLAGINGFTLHTPEGYPPDLASQTLHFDVLIGIALSFHWHGHSSIGARIISEIAHSSHLKTDSRNLIEMASCLAKAGYFSQAMELSSALFEDEDLINNAQLLMSLILVGHGEKLTTTEKEFAYVTLQKMLHRAKKLDTRLASSMEYNSGNLLISNKRYAKGILHYKKAAKLEPDYYNRFYFWKELGGVFFGTRHYEASSKAYACCIKAEPQNTKILPFYADSLMFSGRYKEAKEIFSSYLQKATMLNPCDTEWLLKEYALSFILDNLKVDSQKRNIGLAESFFKSINLENYEEVSEAASGALQNDALNPLAWYNLGITSSQFEEWQTAYMGFLISALVNPSDIESWYNCIASAHHLDDGSLFTNTLLVAYHYHKDDFIRYWSDKSGNDGNSDFIEHLSQISVQLEKMVTGREDVKEIRIHQPSGGFDLLLPKSEWP